MTTETTQRTNTNNMKPFILEDWEIYGDRCSGKVYNNPNFHNGQLVDTSRIQRIVKEQDMSTGKVFMYVDTLNSRYYLGTPSSRNTFKF